MLVDEQIAVQQMASAARTGICYITLSQGGLGLTVEPFFKSMLVAVYREHFQNLLSRARILIPPAEARLMMGVMDETGVLEAGQVASLVSFHTAPSTLEFSNSRRPLFRKRVIPQGVK